MKTAWDEQLRQAGLRVTRPRSAVLDVLAGHPHVDAETIVTAARSAHPTISPQAVYGVLKALVGGGLARRIETGGGRGAVRAAGRRQPPPPCLPGVCGRRRRRLCRGGRSVPGALRRGGVRG